MDILIGLIAWGIIIYLVYIAFLKKKRRKTPPIPVSITTGINFTPKYTHLTEYNIKGMNFRKLNRKLRSGVFMGNVKAEKNNQYDPFAISVFNEKGLHLGYCPSGNEQLHSQLLNNKNGSHPAFGFVQYDASGKYWYGKVVIPLDLSQEQIEKAYDEYAIINS